MFCCVVIMAAGRPVIDMLQGVDRQVHVGLTRH